MIFQIIYLLYFGLTNILYPIDLFMILVRVKRRTGWRYSKIYKVYRIKYNIYKKSAEPVFLRFSLIKDGTRRSLNASFQPCFGIGYILATQEWLISLIVNKTNEEENAFFITLGHELTHNDKDFPLKFHLGKNRKFINWVNEVHADFGAAEKMVACNREKLKESIRFKSKMKPKNKDSRSHPSWKRRLECATNYNFNEELIRKIYEDSGCKNTELLNKVIDFYKDRYIALI